MLERIANERIVEELCGNIGVSPKYIDDFVQEIYLILLEYDQEKIKEIYDNGHIKFFLTRVIKNQWCSSTSPFFKKYRKYYSYIDENNNGNYEVLEIEEDGYSDDD
jgi:hypothetical protein